MSGLIYLDNAATTFPKPRSVTEAVRECMINKGGNPGRGSHTLSRSAAELVYDTREAAAELFDASAENVVFTLNATNALNLAIKGLARAGCHILIDNYSHNAVYRPVVALAKAGVCTFDIYDASGRVDDILSDISKKLRNNTTIIVATHQSNICSRVLPISEIGRYAKKRGIHFIVDGSQSAGHIKISVKDMHITSLCLPGHKGLFGPMGVGLLVSGEGVKYRTVIEGGAGVSSLDAHMPDDLPERLEAGTLPLPAIAGLRAGIRYIREIGEDNIHAYEKMLTSIVEREVASLERVKTYGSCGGSVVSFNVDGYTPSQVGEYFSSMGICVRTGYHCAPIAHKTVGSFDYGSVRAGVSYLNRPSDMYALLYALRQLNSQIVK
ncbi:MAG: aminotransferase class V-fold PLP-dependent enzyme [Ruminococcaceae bacterium]|nr:aminotransferase class V-fold PLP-dependent enzyme [Oscillospiraceae bacterium]